MKTTVLNNGKILKTMSEMDMASMAKEPTEISSFRYNKAIQHMILLRSMGEIDNKETKRLISLLQSPDPENWHVAEECIKQLLS